MSNLSLFKRRIKRHFKNASHTKGIYWYQNAHQYAVMLSNLTGYPLHTVIGVMAALSPNNKWERNKLDTELFLNAPYLKTKVCTFMSQRKKAFNIVHNKLLPDEILKELNGTKTKNFFDNIYNYRLSQNVTVDMWAYRSCGVEQKTKYIKDITLAYQQVAKELKIMPHQLQAVVWGVVRGSHE